MCSADGLGARHHHNLPLPCPPCFSLQALTLVVLGAERVFIGSLLATEELLLQLILKGGAVLGAAAAVVATVYVVWSFGFAKK